MAFAQVLDSLTFKRMDALRENIQGPPIQSLVD